MSINPDNVPTRRFDVRDIDMHVIGWLKIQKSETFQGQAFPHSPDVNQSLLLRTCRVV